MSAARAALLAHLRTGETTVCRAWGVERADGTRLGFTDHDKELAFEGWAFHPETGLTAGMLSQTTGLSVDNIEAEGALSSEAITEADIAAGRYDGAQMTCWMVNWRDPEQRIVLFRGSIGEVTRAGGAFRADLRGLSEELNQPREKVYQRPCAAILGDAACGVDLSDPRYAAEVVVQSVDAGRRFGFVGLDAFEADWFERGRLVALTGAGAGLVGQIKFDRAEGSMRVLELWQELRGEIVPGDTVRLEAGSDKRLATCRAKFANVQNFRGFPHIPGDDWITSYPRQGQTHDGSSYLKLPEADL
ncbi:MAG: DUF2163 domain-containing protein [Pseudomonadota bacterium]